MPPLSLPQATAPQPATRPQHLRRGWVFVAATTVLLPALALGWLRLRTPPPDERLVVVVRTGRGQRQLTVDVFHPGAAYAASERLPAVALLHGVEGAQRYARGHYATARSLADEGYRVFFVHYFDGLPYSDLWRLDAQGRLDTACVAEHCHADSEEWIAAVDAVLAALVRRADVDPRGIGLMGYSLGGYVALASAEDSVRDASLPRVAAVVSHWGACFETTRFPTAYPPVLLVHGEQDTIVPVAAALQTLDQLRVSGGSAELLVVPGAGHLAESEESAQQVREFLRQHLVPPPDSAALAPWVDYQHPSLGLELIARWERGG